MTSIHCPECSTFVSGSDHSCPQCNFPISKLRGLSAAILTRNGERVAGLIQLGADVNAVDKNGRTPLITAALINDPEIVQMLLAAGARPEFVNKEGETALSVAKSREIERLIRRAIVVSKFKQTQTPETAQAPVVQQQHIAEKEAPEKPGVQEQPPIEFDHSIMLTQIAPPQSNQVTPIDVQLNDELFEIENHKVREELPEPFLFEETPPTQLNKTMPVDIQLNEELFESEQPPADQQPVYAEQTIPENQPIYIEPVAVQEFRRPAGQKFFFAALIACVLLLLFMALTWPRYTSSISRISETTKPAKQIAKQEPAKQVPVPKNEIEVVQEPKIAEPIPEAQPSVPLPEPPAEKPVMQSAPKTKLIPPHKAKPVTEKKQEPAKDEGKIRLARALNSQGYALIKQGKFGDAIPVLERSVQSFPKDTKDPHYGYALYNLAIAWRKAGRPDLAIPILEKRMKIADQRNIVARELFATRQEAIDAGFGNF